MEDSNRSFFVIIAILLLALLLLVLAYFFERRRAKREADDLRYEMDKMSHQLIYVQKQMDEMKTCPPQEVPETIPAATVVSQKTSATSPSSSSSFENIYGGKALYESLMNGTCKSIERWSNVDTGNFIEYYRLQHREFVDSLDTDYNNLSRNHKVFMVLLDMGKSDPEIQKLMGITQTTIRSLRFRIKAKRKDANGTEDVQTTIQF